ncbi:uncharacterized protein LAESUDRAFT_370330 [Laetiporus sulphureus 93-53]|uniref:Uncharacterized protein n=1 Tax=Laetiporus sulphureus 93-53 TaxID=1314785 RepID=A0A165CQN1_9APHY|nr:uncharacterized protein LAESUDRAFT_370330 [Laetiporus sulphureus 93-53]KZT03246.1 hypothetical protein LAESUDRAFT_370330 [Laetiporus sulphureus 93-53]
MVAKDIHLCANVDTTVPRSRIYCGGMDLQTPDGEAASEHLVGNIVLNRFRRDCQHKHWRYNHHGLIGQQKAPPVCHSRPGPQRDMLEVTFALPSFYAMTFYKIRAGTRRSALGIYAPDVQVTQFRNDTRKLLRFSAVCGSSTDMTLERRLHLITRPRLLVL